MCISFSCVRVFFTRLPRLLARVTTCTRHTGHRPPTQLTQGWIGYFSPARPRRRRYTVYDGWRWSMWRGCSRLPARHVALPSHAPAPRQVGSTVSRWVSALGGRVLRRGVWLLGGTHRSSPQSAELTAPVERGAWSCAGLAELAVRSSAAEPRSPHSPILEAPTSIVCQSHGTRSSAWRNSSLGKVMSTLPMACMQQTRRSPKIQRTRRSLGS